MGNTSRMRLQIALLRIHSDLVDVTLNVNLSCVHFHFFRQGFQSPPPLLNA
jgi:hypothetical protein